MLRFIRGAFAWLMAILTIGPGLEWCWTTFRLSDDSPPLLWALTFTTLLSILWFMAMLCTYRQGILADEVERCCRAKRELEQAILSNRKSSIRKKKK